MLQPCLFNLYADYIMWNARQDEAQAGITLLGEISITPEILRGADDTTLREERKEKLKTLLIRVEESENSDLKLTIQKTKIMASSPITL